LRCSISVLADRCGALMSMRDKDEGQVQACSWVGHALFLQVIDRQ
jgi:hypothetical protein